ncbi:hypothetical protein ASC67_16980 [Methylibium sp. Root1272]|nr:hypothetical protein ASC67_16980 [Methylibium sp. Root1272]
MRMDKTLIALSRRLLAGLCAGLLVAAPALAETDPADPPARVGSISALRGPVDSSPEAGAAWDPAKLNQPITSETSLWVPPGSQAEVRIGSSSVRLDGNTQAVFSQLDDHGIAIDVAQGTVRARVRSLATGDSFSFSADGVRAEAQAPGDYRVGYDPDRRAYTVRALSGRLRVVTPNNTFNLESGQESLVENGGSELQLRAMGQRDDFDAWAEARDRDQDRLASARYVSPETTGIEALDEHGYWTTAPDYGAIWYPRGLPYGWAPYRYGHWAYVRPWGWTWVDDAPWGFAPFHYGRWALIGGSWGWVPGPIVPRPVYAPALVGYVGAHSGNVSLSIGFGGGAPVGWFPLGPREYYHPPYRYSPRYVQQINVINVVNPPQRPHDDRRATRPTPVERPSYRYAQRPDAVTVVSEDNFRNARSIGRERLDLTPGQMAQLQPVAASLNLPGRPGGAAPGPAGRPGGAASGLPSALLPAPGRAQRPQEPRRAPVYGTRDDAPSMANAPGGSAQRPSPMGQDRRRDEGEPPAAMPIPGRGVPAAGPPNVQRTPVVPQPRPAIVPGERTGSVQDGRDAADRPRSAQRETGPPRGDDRDDRGRRSYVDPGSAERGPHGQRTPRPDAGGAAPAQPVPRPQLSLPQATPSPQAIPRPVPVPAPQALPRPQVAVPNPPPQPMPQAREPRQPIQQQQQQRGRESANEQRGAAGGERRGGGGDGGQRGWSQRER